MKKWLKYSLIVALILSLLVLISVYRGVNNFAGSVDCTANLKGTPVMTGGTEQYNASKHCSQEEVASYMKQNGYYGFNYFLKTLPQTLFMTVLISIIPIIVLIGICILLGFIISLINSKSIKNSSSKIKRSHKKR